MVKSSGWNREKRGLGFESQWIQICEEQNTMMSCKVNRCDKKKIRRIFCETPENPDFLRKGKMVISVKIRNFSRSRMRKRTSPLELSREI